MKIVDPLFLTRLAPRNSSEVVCTSFSQPIETHDQEGIRI